MKIAIIIYIVLCLLGLAVMLYARKDDKESFPDWVAFLIVLFFPVLIIVVLPVALIYQHRQNRKYEEEEQKRREELDRENEDRRQRAEERRKTLWEEYTLAKEKYDNLFDTSFIDVVRKLYQTAKNKDYDNILNCLDKLSLPKDLSFEIDDRFNTEAAGATTKLYVKLGKDEKDEKDEKIFKYINVEDSPMGIWQAFFLERLIWFALPLWWHAYECKVDYVFSKEDLQNIELENKDEDKQSLIQKIQDIDLMPIVLKTEDKYFLSVCHWSNYGGLIRSYVELKIKDNKLISHTYPFHSIIEFKYDCKEII